MIRFICNYLRGCCCKHDFELIAHVKIADYFRGDMRGKRKAYRRIPGRAQKGNGPNRRGVGKQKGMHEHRRAQASCSSVWHAK